MPIEIRELIISAHVDSHTGQGHGSHKGGGKQQRKQESTVTEAVDEVMRILKKKMNR